MSGPYDMYQPYDYQGMNYGPQYDNQQQRHYRGGYDSGYYVPNRGHRYWRPRPHTQQRHSIPRGERVQHRRYSQSGGNDGNNFDRLGSNSNFTEPQQQQRRKVDDEEVKVSKGLAYILRHGANDMELNMNEEGFIKVKDILKLRRYTHVTKNDIIRIVQNNNKQRFHLKIDEGGNLMIGANQGHSIKVEEIDLKPITDAKSNLCVVHGTTYKAWDVIKGEGLKRMNRTHIHFASGEPGEKGVISGMRGSSQVLIYIDLEKALDGGIEFSRSRNGVILSEGNKNGIIDPVFFSSVIDRSTRTSLLTKKRKRTSMECASSSSTTTDTNAKKKK